MKTENIATFEGGCTCGEVRYRLIRSPIIVHCCHCRWCQRETGTAFALNAMIESNCVKLLKGKPERVDTPSNSGKGQAVIRCPSCHIAVWSHYAGAGDLLSFIRVGTLDKPDELTPDIHIYTASKQPWVILPPETPAFEEYYQRSEQLSGACLERLSKLTAGNR
jgi:hypothetical protein